MNYYQRHIGDYAKDTGHLSLLEHGVYTVLLDWSYGTERELPEEMETVYRLCRATSRAEKRAVDAVVCEFFPSRKNKRVCEELSYCEAVSTERRLAALRKHHPDLDATALQELCKRGAIAPRKQGKCSATRARSNSQQPTASNHPSGGGGMQVGDEEILKFGQEWPGEMASGTPSMHPDWLKQQIAKLNGRTAWPNDWKRWLIACWRTDHSAYRQAGTGDLQKNAARRERGEILQELSFAREQKNAARIAELERELQSA